MSISRSSAWKNLKAHSKDIAKTHLRELMFDGRRCKGMTAEAEGIFQITAVRTRLRKPQNYY